MELALWCRKQRDLTPGGLSCPTRESAAAPPSPTTDGNVIIEKLDWIHLPPNLQRQVIQAMARILAQALQPPARQEASDESH